MVRNKKYLNLSNELQRRSVSGAVLRHSVSGLTYCTYHHYCIFIL